MVKKGWVRSVGLLFTLVLVLAATDVRAQGGTPATLDKVTVSADVAKRTLVKAQISASVARQIVDACLDFARNQQAPQPVFRSAGPATRVGKFRSRDRLCGLTPGMGSSTFGENQREYDGRLDWQRGGLTWKLNRRKPPSSARWRRVAPTGNTKKPPRGSETCSPMNLLNLGVRAEPTTNVRSLIGYRKSSGMIQKRNPRSGQLLSSRHDGLRLGLCW